MIIVPEFLSIDHINPSVNSWFLWKMLSDSSPSTAAVFNRHHLTGIMCVADKALMESNRLLFTSWEPLVFTEHWCLATLFHLRTKSAARQWIFGKILKLFRFISVFLSFFFSYSHPLVFHFNELKCNFISRETSSNSCKVDVNLTLKLISDWLI